ncbi:MAG: magnesium/cobalt transporter CorA [Actinomycetota bacterium]
MITTRLYRRGVLDTTPFPVEEIDRRLADPDIVVWVDVTSPDPSDMAVLAREFGVHPLSLEDVLHAHQRPKVESYDGYVFLVAYSAREEGGRVVPLEVDMFAGRNFLVTVRQGEPPYDISEVLRRDAAHPDLLAEGAAFAFYALLDDMVDRFFPVLDALEERMAALEDRVFAAAKDGTVQSDIFALRKDLMGLRRVAAPMRDALLGLLRREEGLFGEQTARYLQDVYDHLLRVIDGLESFQELLSGAIEANLSAISNRLNEVMKVLTGWGAILVADTLIAGIYGMNFAHMPELNWKFGYGFALGLMVVVSLGLYRFFRRRDWL